MKRLECEMLRDGDWNWRCPVCGNWNRAFELPQKEPAPSTYTLAEIKAACPHCTSEEVIRQGWNLPFVAANL